MTTSWLLSPCQLPSALDPPVAILEDAMENLTGDATRAELLRGEQRLELSSSRPGMVSSYLTVSASPYSYPCLKEEIRTNGLPEKKNITNLRRWRRNMSCVGSLSVEEIGL
mmetsp:Transcript_1365/g.2817  ORF Transcript_1365/g.2817 Transcript_1365/m.2817 type:complete len:111 (-) Transcript_1365:325-657(-)